MITVYGIPNCDSVRKARKQLESEGIAYEFVDVKRTALSAEMLRTWLAQQPDKLVNKRSATYRAIKSEWLSVQDDMDGQIALIQANPTVIKRPVIVDDSGNVTVGCR